MNRNQQNIIKTQKKNIIERGLSKPNPSMKFLDLGEDSYVQVNYTIPQTLTYRHSLIHLDLRGNNLGAAAGKQLGNGLKGNKIIKYLDLKGNNLTAQGIEVISLALEYNDTLTYLDLGNNNLQQQGVLYLAPFLKGTKSLTALNINANGLNSGGGSIIAQSLKHNKSLTKLDIGNNYLPADDNSFTECLKDNLNLKYYALTTKALVQLVQDYLKELLKLIPL